jgi:hypothetical protein
MRDVEEVFAGQEALSELPALFARDDLACPLFGMTMSLPRGRIGVDLRMSGFGENLGKAAGSGAFCLHAIR